MLRARLGSVVSEVSKLDDEENKTLGEHFDTLLETYSPVWLSGTGQIIAVAEFYQRTDDLNQEIGNIQRQTGLVVGLTGLLIYLLLAGFVRRASNTILNQQEELAARVQQLTTLLVQNQELSERVRRASASVALLNESYLRRVGAELHDGPAQDLGLSLLKLDSLAGKIEKEPSLPQQEAWVEEINKIEASLQNALKEVRGIAAGLSLPQLTELDLPETVTRVVRTHERQTGTQVALELDPEIGSVALPLKITVYRLVQEALNNAYRHAGGAGQRVRILAQGDQLVVEVSDSGPGFVSAPGNEWNGRLGLSGMRERVESLGGLFSIESQPGQGTTIRAFLPCQVGEKQP
jgi:signal transduction histidine kinase